MICSLLHDLQIEIFSSLSPIELCVASQICQLWHKLANQNSLWLRFLPLAQFTKPASSYQPGILKDVFMNRYRVFFANIREHKFPLLEKLVNTMALMDNRKYIKPVPELTFQVMGAPETGKTSFINFWSGDPFSNNYVPTNALQIKKFTHTFTRLSVLETRLSTQPKDYANALFLFFDLTSEDSFEKVKKMLYCFPTNSKQFVFLIGNKADLQKERKVPLDEIQQVLHNTQALSYFEISCKEHLNLVEAIEDAMHRVLFELPLQVCWFPSTLAELNVIFPWYQKNAVLVHLTEHPIQTQQKKNVSTCNLM